MMELSESGLSKLFKQLENCVALGARCPQTLPFGPLTRAANKGVIELARRGRIKLDIYAHNWRVVTMCEGRHFGKSTEMPPYQHGAPYKTIQREQRNSCVGHESPAGIGGVGAEMDNAAPAPLRS